ALPAAALLACSAAAQPQAQQEESSGLPAIVVTATRSAAPVKSVPGTVTVVRREALDQAQAKSLADVFEQEPGVTVPADPRRFGGGSVNIRGIEDNRVLMLTDGVRAADFRTPGTTNYDASNRDVPELDFVKQVEIVRGPASSLHGSDAIGGVVGFLTLDPQDLLRGRSHALGTKLSYDSADDARRATAHVAAQLSPALDGLLMLSHTEAQESDNKGSLDVQGLARTAPNPQQRRSTAMLAKLAWAPLADHRFKLTLEGKQEQTDTDIQRVGNRSPSSPNTLTRVSANLGHDEMQRWRGVLDYTHLPSATGGGWAWDRMDAKAYRQRQKSESDNWQRRSRTTATCSASSPGSANCEVTQRFEFEQIHTGLSAVATKALSWGAPQQITWGADWLRTHTAEMKATSWVDLATGVVSNTFIGETFPKADYPKGHADQLGLFVQDEVELMGGRLRLTPGLRWDQFRLSPQDDPLYRPTDGRTPSSASGNRVSPKLGASFDLSPRWQAWAQYVEGFRGPNYEETNRFFYNANQRYALLGNPDLKPETSRGVELGLRAGTPQWGGQLSVFHNRYRDFIESRRLAASDPAALPGYTTSQYQNFARVTIEGAELRGQWKPTGAWQLAAGLAYAKGRDQENDRPINSVEPITLTASATWKPSADWGGQLRL
ncbi:MAG: TonB-dependent hemoglobin/transferrin/lactoferrin family receptor, partial [Aquabacterium sp.]|nr:TonB-dependent hemoglobin/transferrin/lactoferrin family receptor [Aquabacterium sp.]